MADGAPSLFKRRSMMAYSDESDPRFSAKPAADEPIAKSKKPQPRVAFTGEEFGFGYQATKRFLQRARDFKTVPDAGYAASSGRIEREFDEASKNSRFNFANAVTQPLRTKEQSLMAVKQLTADFAIIPFYNPYFGYDYESLRAVASLRTVCAVQQVEATDALCLAVHESQLYDLIQSAHPGAGFSSLQRRMRVSYGDVDTKSGNDPADMSASDPWRAGLPIDMAEQKLIRDRIDVVFAGPEAARRCKSKLDGFRAIGIDVQEIAQMVEPHRELARLARENTSSERQTNTFFDPISGETRFFSTLGSESQKGKLFAMVLPYDVASASSDYTIIDHNFEDAEPQKTRFMVVENNPDHSLFEDKYRTTDARTKYWVDRLQAVAVPTGSFGEGFMQTLGLFAGALAVLLIAIALLAVGGSTDFISDLPSILSGLSSFSIAGLAGIAGIFAFVSWLLLSVRSAGRRGVRVLMAFRRNDTAAAIGDIENYLRNFGVRHSVVRMDEDSQRGAPADIALDIEFDPSDFSYGPFAAITRRLRGSVVNGAMKKAFQRWKHRGARVLAVMPYDTKREFGFPEAQLPKHKPRRWWSEAVGAWFGDVAETMFIRFSRIIAFYLLPATVLAFVIWRVLLNG